jgi:hypothetical protein
MYARDRCNLRALLAVGALVAHDGLEHLLRGGSGARVVEVERRIRELPAGSLFTRYTFRIFAPLILMAVALIAARGFSRLQ